MQTCYNCGKEVDDNVLICPDCGALVRRYGAPVREPEPEPEQPRQFAPNPYFSTKQNPRSYVIRDESGTLRLRGFLKVLCIICVIADLYLAFSQFFVLWLSSSGDFFTSMMSEYSALGIDTAIIDMMNFTVDFVNQNPVFVILLGSAFLLKAACFIWFQLTKRRLCLYVCGVIAAVIVAVFLITGGGIGAFEYCLDILVVLLLLLRRDWNTLPK